MKKKHENPWQMVAMIGTMGIEILFLTIGGAWLGRQLDEMFDFKPICLLIGILLGLGFGFASAFYTLRSFMKDD